MLSSTIYQSLPLQEHLWQKLGVLMEKLRVSIVAVWHMQRVLAKKRDPLTHVLFIDGCLDEMSPLPSEHIWYGKVHATIHVR